MSSNSSYPLPPTEAALGLGDGVKIKRYLTKANPHDAINDVPLLTLATKGDPKGTTENDELLYLVTNDAITYRFHTEGILSHIENQLWEGRSFFNITLEIPRDEDENLVIKFDEALWKQQMLRQPCGQSERISGFFYKYIGCHNRYRRDHKALPMETLAAVENYIQHLERYSDDQKARELIDSVFDQEHYGFRAGPFFTVEEAAECLCMKTPAGSGLTSHLLRRSKHEGCRGTDKTAESCISQFLLPQLRNLFRPGFEEETSIKLSPLYREEVRKERLEDGIVKPTKDNISAHLSKKRALESPSSHTIDDIQEVAVKRQKVPSGMVKGGDDDDGGAVSTERGIPETAAGLSEATITAESNATGASLSREIKPVRKGFNAFKSMGKARARGPKKDK